MGPESNRGSSRAERQARVAEVRATQARAERRRHRIILLAVVVVVLALTAITVVLVRNAERERAAVAEVAAEPIAGEVTEEVGTADHVTGDVPDEQVVVAESDTGVLPPMGGDHDPVVQNCGFYTEPVRDENAVHSLEHGAVWITYRLGLDQAQVSRLSELAAANPYLLASPYPDLGSPVVATAWGVQLEVESATDERLAPFLERYLQGQQTPEPGAPCSGGLGG